MISEKLKTHLGNYVTITRVVAPGVEQTTRGYILNFSDELVLLHEADNFMLHGYVVLPVSQLKKIRHNKFDKCFKQIMIAEGEAAKVGIGYNIDLSNWQSVFKSIQAVNLGVTVEIEDPANKVFSIGPILKVTTKKIHIEYFDAEGFISDTPDKISYNDITKVTFDNRYVNIFGKYLRKKRVKTQSVKPSRF